MSIEWTMLRWRKSTGSRPQRSRSGASGSKKTRTEAKLQNAEVADVQKDVRLDREDQRLVNDLKGARLIQAQGFRTVLFYVALSMAALCILTSVALVVGMVFLGYGRPLGKMLSPTIVVAFISGLTVETVSLLVVISQYLYPKDQGVE
jgi:hypothetical protein